jgi:uncharacterized membrane protein YdjX (TVP38/TMEM64 family)
MSSVPPLLRLLALAAIVVASAATVAVIGLPSPEELAAAASSLGPWSPIVVVAVTAALLTVLVPRAVLAVAGGLLFGPVLGSVYVMAGVGLGSLAAFMAGRRLGRDFVASQPRLAGLDGWLTARGALGVAALRLLPVAPFGLISYAFGATGIRLRSYLLGTVAGAAPSTALHASLGAAAASADAPLLIASTAAALAFAVGGLVVSVRVRRHDPSAGRAASTSGKPHDPVQGAL